MNSYKSRSYAKSAIRLGGAYVRKEDDVVVCPISALQP